MADKSQAWQSMAVKALLQERGDDRARAEQAFRNYTPAAMQQPYGFSGQTCAEVLEDYRRHEKDCNDAIAWVRRQTGN